MKLSEAQAHFSLMIAKLIIWGKDEGYTFTFGEANRTDAQQILYYTGYDIVINNDVPVLIKSKKKTKTLNSNHKERLAIDLNIFKNGKYITSFEDTKPVGDKWESMDIKNRWGGDWNKNDIKDGFIDTPHFEYKHW